MKVNQVFEIKFAYKGENEKGELSKKKLNVLAQCTNYTEAEKLAHTLIAIQELEKFEKSVSIGVIYIIRCKFSQHTFVL